MHTLEHIKQRSEELAPWYHQIELAPGVVTRSCMLDSADQWDAVRRIRAGVDYNGKAVLDLGTMDGMWAFEAEKLGARITITGDIFQVPVEQSPSMFSVVDRFQFAKECLSSRVLLVPNCDAHNLQYLLSSLMEAAELRDGFDIVQCLGLLYHVRNPLLVLDQIRKVLKPNGRMLLETACCMDSGNVPWIRLNDEPQIYNDTATYMLPNKAGLVTLLKWAGFELSKMERTLSGDSYRYCLWTTLAHA